MPGDFLLTKDKKEKGLASSSGVSALLGITEPAIFGVNLKKRYPFFIALIGSAVGCFIVGLFGIRSSALGAAGLIGFISFPVKYYAPFFLAIALSIVVAFTGTFLYGKRVMAKAPDDSAAAADAPVASTIGDEVIAAPVSGTPISLKAVNDQVFATQLMGKGAAIVPTDDTIYAPVAGTITVAYPTMHAYGIKADNGAEVLIHLGIDTVKLGGLHFTTAVTQGQHVQLGDVLGTADIAAIKAAGYDPTVMVVVTNTPAFGAVDRIDTDQVTHAQPLVALTRPTDEMPVAAAL